VVWNSPANTTSGNGQAPRVNGRPFSRHK
jgi:hypothetical protein